MTEEYLKLIESLAKEVVAAVEEDSFTVFSNDDDPIQRYYKTDLQLKISELARQLKYKHEHGDGCGCG